MKIYHISKNIYPEVNELCNKLKSEISLCNDACTINGIKIELIDGNKVKTKYNMDFVEGGSDLVYKFIPAKTIWIDKAITSEERPHIILHELIERHLMEKYNVDYEKAHDIANVFEKKSRKE
jgi:hypothetical protein